MNFDAAHLPLAHARETFAVVQSEDVHVHAPVLTADDVRDVCARLIAARAALARMSTSRIIDAIDAATIRLAEDAALPPLLAACTRSSLPMAGHVLQRMLQDWRAPVLHALVRAELGDAGVLDGFHARDDGAARHAQGPPLALHVFAGNVIGVAVTSIIRSLLVRSAVLGKSAAGEPVLAPAFARALAHVDPEVGACVAVTYWRGGDEALEAAALEHAEIVVHYGGADAIASLRRRAPHTTFVEHGPRVSVALVNAPAPTHAAADLASAVAMFDQQGCVSPQVAYVVGGREQARAFAADVASELHALQQSLPRGRIDAAEAAAIREVRARAEFRAIAGADIGMWGGESLDYTVILGDDLAFEGSCLNRTLIVKQAHTVDAVIDALRPVRSLLQTAGIAGFDRASGIAHRLADIGVTRITTLAGMPWPPMTWQHDGRGPLRELVRFVDDETML